jgi:hypothetical protein
VDVRGSPGKRDYPEVIYLLSWATADGIWPYFDGWCASRNVDHESLPWSTWLNLVYYFAVRNASHEDKKKFDDAIAEAVAGWHLAKAKPVIEQARKAAREEPKPGATRERRMPPKPSGWGSPATNTFNSKAAIKTLTAGGVSGKKRRE